MGMMWNMDDKGQWHRSCGHCGGTGEERLQPGNWSACRCNEHWSIVDHPANTANNREKYRSVWWQVMRCDKCGLFWLEYFEHGDDSVDYPAPVLLGNIVPDNNWRESDLRKDKS